MPYIRAERRKALADNAPITGAGELNYMITMLLRRYWTNSPQNYAAINDIVGAIEGAKLEFYRRVVGPYENTKIADNGDVYL